MTEAELAYFEELKSTRFTPNKIYMHPAVCRSLFGVDPEPFMNEDGVVEMNPPPQPKPKE